ncbi:MAG: sulfite exporter TauE/SafE family protein [bacterium]|nr:sulfite exporter TauE/SafE family protein [bacterium]
MDDFTLALVSTSGLGLMFGLILLGSTLQVATGVGLGLIAGPSLLYFLDSISAVQTAIILNLVLTLFLLPSEKNAISHSPLLHLSIWFCLGLPLGFALLFLLEISTLKLIGAAVILLSVVQLKFFPAKASKGTDGSWMIRVGGSLSGAMTGALAIPGPVALWALLSSGLDTVMTRATLRAYFVIAYTLTFLLHLGFIGSGQQTWGMSGILVPAVIGGIIAGKYGRRYLEPDQLRHILEIVLVIMGLSLLIKGVLDVT